MTDSWFNLPSAAPIQLTHPSPPSTLLLRYYGYDVWGNITHRGGWGGVGRNENLSYTNNRQTGVAYDAAGNLVDGTWYTFSYDATGQQTRAACPGYVLDQAYDGESTREEG